MSDDDDPPEDLAHATPAYRRALWVVAAAAVLLAHRTGDANVRAVWLFSRNDAVGNLAAVVAAGLVCWSGPRPMTAAAHAISATPAAPPGAAARCRPR